VSIEDLRRDPASLYKLAVEQATDYVIFLLDPDARIVTWAPPVARMLGWSADEFVGMRFRSLFVADDVEAGVPDEAMDRATAVGHVRYTRQHTRLRGGTIWAHGRIARIDDASGLIGFVVSIQDVTSVKMEHDRHVAEEASLRHRAAELETLLEVVPIGIGIARDASASHVQINRSFAELLRMSSQDNASLSAPAGERPRHFRVLRDGRELSPEDLPLQKAARTGKAISNVEVDVVFDDGDRVRLLEHVSPLFDEQGVSRGSVGAFIDVTERKNYEEQRERMLAAEREARQEAERANVIKDEFLAGLSHEIRTPLNAILGWAHILRHTPSMPEDAKAGLEVIERNARLQTRLIEDLLDLSRIVSGKIRLDVQQVTLASVVQAAIDSIQPGVIAKGLRLVTVVDPYAGPIAGDPVRLQQVLWNLLANSVKFTPKGGQISVVLERVDSHLELSVSDTGIGITPEFLPHVFDRFRQADGSTTRSYGGLGVGLSIVKQLVELHGGTVSARSPGERLGSTFVVSLPVMALRNEAVQGHPDGDGAARPTHHAPSLAGVSVLVVEDDDDSRALLAAMLGHSGAMVVAVDSASGALAALEGQLPHVIISDIGLPEQDGYGLIRAIRAMPAPHGRVPAMALTAYARSDDRRLALLAGFQLHMSKPVDKDELCTAVASLAGRL
jgi:PAS domain S-box-containing protein